MHITSKLMVTKSHVNGCEVIDGCEAKIDIKAEN